MFTSVSTRVLLRPALPVFFRPFRSSSLIRRRRLTPLPITPFNPRRSMAADSGFKYDISKSEDEWRKILSAEEFHILRQKGTERAFTGKYDKLYPKQGYFACKGCDNPLYSWQSKFDAGCGWPAFDKCYKNSVRVEPDHSLGRIRNEILCAKCGGHLGHVFAGERFTETNERHCVNSVSVKYVDTDAPEMEEEIVAAKK